VHTEILTPDQIAVLDVLSGVRSVRRFYLAGGTALALRHGHRRSVDFDFFRRDGFDGRKLSAALEGRFGRFEPLPSGRHTLYARLQGVTASFFRIDYPLLAPAEPTPWGFGLASDRDLAAMKLEAIAGRGSRKDFIDLCLLCDRGATLEAVFQDFEQKYGAARTDRYHRLRALGYFVDAEAEPMPEMLVPFDWKRVTAFFQSEVERLLRAGLAD
jgi:hypothetical protein